jgi:hypothetical protein
MYVSSMLRRPTMRQPRGCCLVVVALALLVVLGSMCEAAAPGFNARYDASSGKFPDQVCPPWALSDSATPENPALSGGSLVLATDQTAEDLGSSSTTCSCQTLS